MGRYTTIQAYADNSGSMRAVSYYQAAGTSSTTAPADRGPVVTEKVDNPYGSTAGAGSGEFHVYRHARAREMARWKEIHANEAEMKAEEDFQRKVAENERVEAEKTEKRRRKREREKNAKRRKKNMKLGGISLDNEGENEEVECDADEFEYIPIAAAASESKSSPQTAKSNNDKTEEKTQAKGESVKDRVIFANDGSFLEQSKKLLASTE